MSANLLSCELLLHVNELETLEQLVLNGADLNYQAKNGWCLLFEFVSLNLTKQLKFFGPKLKLDVMDTKGRTALFWAIYHNHTKSVKTLLELGYNVHHNIHPSLPALHYAVYKGNPEIVQLIIETGIDINQEDILHKTALTYAQMYEYTEMANLLKSKGAVNPI